MSEEFSTFFEDAARSYNVKSDEYYLSEALSDPVKIAIKKFENQPSVLDIKQNILVIQNFYFSNKDVSDVLKETTALNNKKNGTFGSIPTKHLKEMSDICTPPLNNFWNKETKLVNVTLVFKKEDASLLKNYRPASVLLVVSKMYERIMEK